MIANTANHPTVTVFEATPFRRPDPVRARVTGGQQLTHFQGLQSIPETHSQPEHRGLFMFPGTRAAGHRPHPADVLYWAACLGGVCLLLLSATT